MTIDFIRRERMKHGHSQDRTAKALGMTRKTYSKLEKGRRTLWLYEAEKLAKLYNRTISDIIEEYGRTSRSRTNKAE
jgi:transcriptional regulator with XRE-family HTH domain